MTGIVRGVKKVVKKVVKGVKKIFKKVTESSLGKALLIGAAIFTGGAALGAWKLPGWVPFSSKINGALVKGGGTGVGEAVGQTAISDAANAKNVSMMLGEDVATSAASGATGGASAGQGLVSSAMRPPPSMPAGASMTVTPQAGVSGEAVAGTTAGTAAGAGSPSVTSPTVTAPTAPTVISDAENAKNVAMMLGEDVATKPKGIISRLMEGAGKTFDWMERNPLPAMMGMQGLASAFSPDEIDLMRARQDIREEDIARWNENWDVSNIDLGLGPRKGLVNRNMGT